MVRQQSHPYGWAFVVDGVGFAATPAEGAEIRHRPGVPEERISVAGPNDLSRAVDAISVALRVAGKGPQIAHRAVLPEEGVVPCGGVAARPDHLAGVVDGTGHASAIRRQDTKVRHGHMIPK